MRIFSTMVVREEEDRYLHSVLSWLSPIVDGISVYDDQSRDGTAALARSFGCQVKVRPDGVPGFLEHEGAFRQAAWDWFEESLQPEEGDWVLAVDADEFPISSEDERSVLEKQCLLTSNLAFLVPIPEIWSLEEDPDGRFSHPQVRVDGFWGTIAGTRLFRYLPNGRFADRAMGSGSEPTYLRPPYDEIRDFFILHVGYAEAADVKAKYERYMSLPGHASAHVQSIMEAPVLCRWDGPFINVWKGVPS